MNSERTKKKQNENLPSSEPFLEEADDGGPWQVPKAKKKKQKAPMDAPITQTGRFSANRPLETSKVASKTKKSKKKTVPRVTLGTARVTVGNEDPALGTETPGIEEIGAQLSQRRSRSSFGVSVLESLPELASQQESQSLPELASQQESQDSQRPFANSQREGGEIIVGDVAIPIGTTLENNPAVLNPVNDGPSDSQLIQLVANEAAIYPGNLVQGINPEMRLLDLPFEKWGTCLGFQKAAYHIPIGLWDRIRRIFIAYGEKLVDDHNRAAGVREENMIMHWKKFLLLPLLLLTHTNRKELLSRLTKLEGGNWHFQIRDLLRENKPRKNYVSVPGHRLKITKAIGKRAISKAAQILNQGARDSGVDKRRVFEKLNEKYPHPERDQDWELRKNAITSYRVPNQDLKLKVTPERLKYVIQKCKNMTRPGIDQLKFEDVKTLIGDHFGKQEREELQFTSILAHVIELIANADHPACVGYALRDSELIAIPKDGDDIRPIAMGSTYRKLASKLWFLKLFEFNKEHFKKFQYGLKERGMEEIIHSLKMEWERHPDYDVYLVDASNAFNTIDRVRGLTQVKNHFPGILPFLSSMYMEESNCWFHGKTDMIDKIRSDEGFHQGDVLSSWLYVLSLQPLLHLIDERVKAKFGQDCHYAQYWYIDDGTIIAPRDIMLEIIQVIRDEGPRFGYHINLNKGVYLIGNCGSTADAVRARSYVREAFAAIPEEKIVFDPAHYDDYEDYGNFEDILFRIQNPHLTSENYGAMVLGSPIGSDLYIEKQLSNVVMNELEVVAEKLIEHESNQEKWVLFTRSFLFKPYHLFKTVSPRLTKQFADNIEALKKRILASLIDCNVTDLDECTTAISNIPIEKGGLGLRSIEDISIASYIGSLNDLYRDSNDFDIEENIPHIADYVAAIACIPRIPDEVNAEEYFTVPLLQAVIDKRKEDETTQHLLTTILMNGRVVNVETSIKSNIGHYHWFKSLQNLQSGKWLETIPTNRKLTMLNDQFSTALRYRLYMSYEGWSSTLVCPCGNKRKEGGMRKYGDKVLVDRHGDHLATGCNLHNQRSIIHDSVVADIRGLLNYCGERTMREQKHLFGDNHLRPDITIFDYKGKAQKMLLDVSIPATLKYHYDAQINQKICNGTPLRSANHTYALKNNEYLEKARVNGHLFKPFIIESCGLFHPDTYEFLKYYAKKKEKTLLCKGDTILNYMLKSISVTLQCALADSMKRRFESLLQGENVHCACVNNEDIYHNVGRYD